MGVSDLFFYICHQAKRGCMKDKDLSSDIPAVMWQDLSRCLVWSYLSGTILRWNCVFQMQEFVPWVSLYWLSFRGGKDSVQG